MNRIVDCSVQHKPTVVSDSHAASCCDPDLSEPRADAKLLVPSLERVVQSRRCSTLRAGNSCWTASSNSDGLVKCGRCGNAVIGQFHADGLTVKYRWSTAGSHRDI
jgi:hypothetical protein